MGVRAHNYINRVGRVYGRWTVIDECESIVECSRPIWSGFAKNVPILNAEMDFRDNLEFYIETLQEKPSIIDPTHIEEGFIIQIEKYPTPYCLKAKGFSFKVMEGIIKDTGVVDVEEAS
jgi:hypothetical protein